MRLVYHAATSAELNCVRFYGITVLKHGPAQGLFLVFDLASRGSIDEYLHVQGENLRWDDVLKLFHDIATGLESLHERGISHGLEPASTYTNV